MVGKAIAVVATKGGVGKSTIAAHLALGLAAGGRRVVAVDADPQGTLLAWLRLADAAGVLVEGDTFEAEAESGPWLERIAERKLEADVVVIDAPPHSRDVTESALIAAELVIIPTGAGVADVLALEQAVAQVRVARVARSYRGPAVLVVPNRIDARRSTDQELGALLARIGEPVAPALGSRSAWLDAFGGSVAWTARGSRAHDELERLLEAVTKAANL